MDDAYIHLTYAGNLVNGGGWIFSFPDEKGVGTTSPLWVLLLSAAYLLGALPHWLAKATGILALIAISIGIYRLMIPIWGSRLAFPAAFFVTVSGNMIWFALSGMETVPFLALGILALLAYRAQKWTWLGLLLGLQTLTRPEGILLALALTVVEWIRQKRLPRQLLASILLCLLICGPWFAYLYWRTGDLLPTSASGKRLTFELSLHYFAGQYPAFRWVARFPFLLFIGQSLIHLIEFTLGGMSMPAPRLPVGNLVGIPDYSISVWAALGWAVVIIPLALKTMKRLTTWRAWRSWMQDDLRRPFVVFVVWASLLVLSYMLILPMIGTAGRYVAIGHVALWMGLVIGLAGYADRPHVKFLLTVSLAGIALSNTVYWNRVYNSNVEHMETVRIAAARYVRDNIPASQQCAAVDVGAVTYYSHRPIVDLGGLIELDAEKWIRDEAVDRYLISKNVTCLIVPGGTADTREGFIDFAEITGLNRSSLIQLEPVATFTMDRSRWVIGYLATMNQQASIVIYRIRPGP